MKVTKNGKRYDSAKMETLAENTAYNHSNNISGGQFLMRASDGTYWLLQTSNGQDCFRDSYLEYIGAAPEDATAAIEEYNLDEISEENEKRLVQLKIVTVVA